MKKVFLPSGWVNVYRWNWGIVVGGVPYARGWVLVRSYRHRPFQIWGEP